MTLPDTVSGVEVAWVALALAAAALNAWALRDARCDLETLEQAGRNGLLRIAGRAGVVRETKRLSVQLIFLAAGIVALFDPPPTGNYAESRARLLIVLALFVAQGVNAVGAVLDRRARGRMLHYDDVDRAQRGRRSSDHPDAWL